MMDTADKVANYFSASPKRQLALERHIDNVQTQASKQKRLKELCRTRWVERHNAFETFCELYVAIVSCLEERAGSNLQEWNHCSIVDAKSHLRALLEFTLIITLVITKNVLSYTRGLSVKLQGKWQDIIRAYESINSVIDALKDARKSIDLTHNAWFDEACSISGKLKIQPSIPRTALRQIHRSNHPADSVSEYFKCSISIPILDYLISQMTDRFDPHSQKAVRVLKLIPTTIVSSGNLIVSDDISEITALYADELPSASTLNSELHQWTLKWKNNIDNATKCNTLLKALHNADSDFFPNIHTLLKIASTIPITSCECERSISKLRLVKSFLRTTMSQDRLNGLMLLYAHRDIDLDVDVIIDMFVKKHPRRIKLGNILSD